MIEYTRANWRIYRVPVLPGEVNSPWHDWLGCLNDRHVHGCDAGTLLVRLVTMDLHKAFARVECYYKPGGHRLSVYNDDGSYIRDYDIYRTINLSRLNEGYEVDADGDRIYA
jgi:hypothetical protein